jgi:hypothetical protein
MNISDHISESWETLFGVKILKFFDAYPDPGIQDPGSTKFGPGITIPDPQNCSDGNN